MKSWRQGVKRKWQTLLDTPLSREVIDRCGYLVDRANIKSKVWKEVALEWVPPPVSKKSPLPKSAQTSAPPPPPRIPGAQGDSLDGRGWIYAPGPGWGAHYCQLTALTGPRGVLCVHLGVPVQATVGASGPLWGPNITPVWSLVAYMGLGRALWA